MLATVTNSVAVALLCTSKWVRTTPSFSSSCQSLAAVFCRFFWAPCPILPYEVPKQGQITTTIVWEMNTASAAPPHAQLKWLITLSGLLKKRGPNGDLDRLPYRSLARFCFTQFQRSRRPSYRSANNAFSRNFTTERRTRFHGSRDFDCNITNGYIQ